MTASGMKIRLNQSDNYYSLNDGENQLNFTYSEHLEKYLVIFNAKIMSSTKNIGTAFNQFTKLKEKYNL